MSNDIFPRESRLARLKTMSPSAGATIAIEGDKLVVRGVLDAQAHVLRRAKVAAGMMGFEIAFMAGTVEGDATIISIVEASR